MDVPVLTTARLRLRPPREADIPDLVAMLDDWEVVSRLGRVPYPYGVADARYFLDVVVRDEWVWAIIEPPGEAILGTVALTPAAAPGSAELGYYVARPEWGRGIATEAAAAVLRHGQAGLGLGEITSGWFADNPASGRVLAKLGFVETGRGERHCLARRAMLPLVRMRLPDAAGGAGA